MSRHERVIYDRANEYLATRQSYLDIQGMRKEVNKFIESVNKNVALKAGVLKPVEPVRFEDIRIDTVYSRVRLCDYQSRMGAFNGPISDQTLLMSIGLGCIGIKAIEFTVFYDLDKEEYMVRFDDGADCKEYNCSGSRLGNTIISHFPVWVKTFAKTPNKLVQELKKYFTFTEGGGVLKVEQIPGKTFPGYDYATDDQLGKVVFNIKYDYEARKFLETYKNRSYQDVRFNTMRDKRRAIDSVIAGHKRKWAVVNTDHGRGMFFHSGKPDDSEGVNTAAVKKFMKLYSKGKADYFVCCHPDNTGIDDHYISGTGHTGRVYNIETDDPLIWTMYTQKAPK